MALGDAFDTSPIAILAAVLLLGWLFAPMFISTTTPDEVQGYNNGFQALQSYVTAENPQQHMGTMVQFFLVPLLTVFTLVYAVLEAGVGRFFPANVIAPLAAIFSLSSLFSGWFIPLAGIINVFGVLGLVVMAMLGMLIAGMMTMNEWRWKRKSADSKVFEKEENLESKFESLKKEMNEERRKGRNKSGSVLADNSTESRVDVLQDDGSTKQQRLTFNQLIEEFMHVSLSDKRHLTEYKRKAENIRSNSGGTLTDHGRRVMENMEEALQLADKFERYEKREEREIEDELGG